MRCVIAVHKRARAAALGFTVLVLLSCGLLLTGTSTPAAAVPQTTWSGQPDGYVYTPSAACPYKGPPTAYRVCDDQMALFAQGLETARREGKLLLIVFGATWCPWCKTLHQALPGPELLGSGDTETDLGKRFHMIEIATSATAAGKMTAVPSGETVLAHVLAKAPGANLRAVPFLAALDPSDGSRAFARNLDDLQPKSGTTHELAGVRAVLRSAHDELRLGQKAPGEPGWLSRKLSRLLSR